MAVRLGGYAAKQCAEKVRKDHDPRYKDIQQDPVPAGVQSRMDSGVEFELRVGEVWEKALGSAFRRIDTCDRSDSSKSSREAETSRLMGNPGRVKVIWNARLTGNIRSGRAGEPDALVWAGKVGGVHRWHPVDVKDHKVLTGTRKAAQQAVSALPDPGLRSASAEDLGPGSLKLSNALQLAHYQRMLQEAGHAHPDDGCAIVGREEKIVWHDLNAATHRHPDGKNLSAYQWYDLEFARRLEIARKAIRAEGDGAPEWKSECTSCSWRTNCHDELDIDLDHITLVPGITPSRALAHYKSGVSRRGQLARLERRTAELIDAGVDLAAATIWARFADGTEPVSSRPEAGKEELQAYQKAGITTASDVLKLDQKVVPYSGTGVHRLASAIDQTRVSLAGKVYRARGVDSVSVSRAAYEQDIDIEDAEGFVYLIGVRTTGYKRVGENVQRRAEYQAFVTWDRTDEAEAANFAEFWEHITGAQAYAKAKRYGYVAYYYGHHEPSWFRKLAERHSDKPGVPTVAEVERFFDMKNVVNLHEVVSRELVWPTPTTGLKDVAKWARFSWRDEDPSGDNSLAWYRSAIADTDEAVRESMRARIIEYNADDTAAQASVRDWLVKLGEARKPGVKLGNVADLERRFERRR